MRALRVVGLHEDGKSVVCEDPERGERFLLLVDDKLRAAARGDIARFGQVRVESEGQMRPREIQARIRAGESVEQVAAVAGIPAQRVERFAYPVLLERSRTAELAQHAHPVREDGPDVRTLGEVVAHAFSVRGQDYGKAEWDSWRGEEGKWVVALRWHAGRSDNSAHWSFSPGAHGGTVTALDEHAEEMLDPHRAPRTLRAVEPETVGQPAPPPPEPATAGESLIPRPTTTRPGTPRTSSTPRPADPKPKPKTKKGHPVVPSWEDVLLGVRSQRG